MENLFDRFGMYEIFSEIITGMIVSLILLFFFPIDLILKYVFINRDLIFRLVNENDIVTVICWLLISYLLGMIIHQLADIVESVLKIRDSMKENFLELNKVYDNYEDIYKYIPYLKKELKKNKIAEASQEDIRNVQKSFFEKALIYTEENQGKYRSTRLDSIYAMSRNLSCSFTAMAILFLAFNIFIGGLCFAISAIFYYKAHKYAKLRTRFVLKQYRIYLERS